MPRGLNVNSGPKKDPNSLNSMNKGIVFTSLPREGYDGKIPRFPLPAIEVWEVFYEDKRRCREFDPVATENRRKREAELWRWAWRTPQAAAWAVEPWRWQSIAHWVRSSVVCEGANASAADKNALHRFADQIGLTPQGMAYNGWKVAPNEVAEKRADNTAPAPSTRGRLSAVRNESA